MAFDKNTASASQVNAGKSGGDAKGVGIGGCGGVSTNVGASVGVGGGFLTKGSGGGVKGSSSSKGGTGQAGGGVSDNSYIGSINIRT